MAKKVETKTTKNVIVKFLNTIKPKTNNLKKLIEVDGGYPGFVEIEESEFEGILKTFSTSLDLFDINKNGIECLYLLEKTSIQFMFSTSDGRFFVNDSEQ